MTKIILMPILLSLSFIPINNDNKVKTNLVCEDPEICSCIAAGGCEWSAGSSCRIEYCSGTVETESFNSAPGNITVINQPCIEEPE
jgi:hypothetical protein